MRANVGKLLLWLLATGFAIGSAEAGNRGVLMLTFDDGLFGTWKGAMPLFAKYGAKATFFTHGEITPDKIEGMRMVKAHGHSIGLHGLHHWNANDQVAKRGADGYLKAEVEPQVKAVTNAGLVARNWAYPNCRRDEASDAALSRYFTRMRGNSINLEHAFMPREGLDQRHLFAGHPLSFYANGGIEKLESALEKLAERNEAMVIYSHGIYTKPNHRNHVSIENLERILKKCKELGIEMIGFDDLDAK